ncbi:MAG: hypothetical protein WC756_07015 [Taibaiella sp.]|jgi:hypothetical protein
MFLLKRYSDEFKKKWDTFIKSSRNGLFFFERNYIEYHSDRFTDHSLILFKGEEIVAVFPASEKDGVITSHAGLTYGSLITDFHLKTKNILDIFEQITHYYKDNNCTEIIYKCIPSIYHKYPADEDLYALFRNNAQLIRRDICSVIKLSNKIRFNETKRQHINKCIKKNIIVTENEDFSNYWELLTEVLQKFEVKPVHTAAEIHLLKTRFPASIRLFEAFDSEILLAGIVIFDFGQVAHTQYMAASNEGRKMGALDFINHHLIEEVFSDKEYFSFGISTEDRGRVLNEGLIQQKENMGGRGITLDFYSITL